MIGRWPKFNEWLNPPEDPKKKRGRPKQQPPPIPKGEYHLDKGLVRYVWGHTYKPKSISWFDFDHVSIY